MKINTPQETFVFRMRPHAISSSIQVLPAPVVNVQFSPPFSIHFACSFTMKSELQIFLNTIYFLQKSQPFLSTSTKSNTRIFQRFFHSYSKFIQFTLCKMGGKFQIKTLNFSSNSDNCFTLNLN